MTYMPTPPASSPPRANFDFNQLMALSSHLPIVLSQINSKPLSQMKSFVNLRPLVTRPAGDNEEILPTTSFAFSKTSPMSKWAAVGICTPPPALKTPPLAKPTLGEAGSFGNRRLLVEDGAAGPLNMFRT